jgi:diguanylate cyclase (GGDEF)-like protein
VTTWSVVTAPGVAGSGAAIVRLIVGLLISLLLGVLIYLLGTSRSRAVQEVSETTAKLRHLALHDSLTGLPNRTLILDRLDQMMVRSRREHTRVAALFVDLDNFKQINDTLGHNAGDELLTEVGRRLTGALRDQDTVGRLGGDEFVVLVEGTSLVAGSEVVADRVLEALSEPFDLEGSEEPVRVFASIGIAEGERAHPEELLHDADIALYEAKAAGKRHAVTFSRSMQEALDDRRQLELDLHRALDAGQFVVRYVPTTDLSTRTVTGVDARLGWVHPTRGDVPASTFLPALESSGEIVPVGRWLLRTAASRGAASQRMGAPIPVSVDVSATEFAEDDFVDDVRDVLALTGLDPSLVVMTFAETALTPAAHFRDDAAVIARLLELKATGVRIALGEFDGGASFLTYLPRYPIDILKVEQPLVAGIVDPAGAASLADTLAQLGRVFGVDVVVEGSGPPGEFESSPTIESELLSSIIPVR